VEGTLLTTIVQDDPEKHRYEVYADEQLARFSEYKLDSDQIAFTHTEIGEEFSGQGLARKLVADALADSRRRGLAVLPPCPNVRRVIADNPDKYVDLVPAKACARFKLPFAGAPDHADLDTSRQEDPE
jgi:predicted GNAT family acetyltransferase